MKFKGGFVTEYQKNEQIKNEQEMLRQKHNIEDENLIVIEKANFGKFLIRTAGIIIRTLATVAIAIMAAVGIIAIVYPDPRLALFGVLSEMYHQMLGFLGVLK